MSLITTQTLKGARTMTTIKEIPDFTATLRRDYFSNGEPEIIEVNIRWNDHCNNGHNDFAITADIYTTSRHPREPKLRHKSGRVCWLSSCGCQHNEVKKRFPQLAKYIHWHLAESDDPSMYYIENSMFWAGHRGKYDDTPNWGHFTNTAHWGHCKKDAEQDPAKLSKKQLEERLKERKPELMQQFQKALVELMNYLASKNVLHKWKDGKEIK